MVNRNEPEELNEDSSELQGNRPASNAKKGTPGSIPGKQWRGGEAAGDFLGLTDDPSAPPPGEAPVAPPSGPQDFLGVQDELQGGNAPAPARQPAPATEAGDFLGVGEAMRQQGQQPAPSAPPAAPTAPAANVPAPPSAPPAPLAPSSPSAGAQDFLGVGEELAQQQATPAQQPAAQQPAPAQQATPAPAQDFLGVEQEMIEQNTPVESPAEDFLGLESELGRGGAFDDTPMHVEAEVDDEDENGDPSEDGYKDPNQLNTSWCEPEREASPWARFGPLASAVVGLGLVGWVGVVVVGGDPNGGSLKPLMERADESASEERVATNDEPFELVRPESPRSQASAPVPTPRVEVVEREESDEPVFDWDTEEEYVEEEDYDSPPGASAEVDGEDAASLTLGFEETVDPWIADSDDGAGAEDDLVAGSVVDPEPVVDAWDRESEDAAPSLGDVESLALGGMNADPEAQVETEVFAADETETFEGEDPFDEAPAIAFAGDDDASDESNSFADLSSDEEGADESAAAPWLSDDAEDLGAEDEALAMAQESPADSPSESAGDDSTSPFENGAEGGALESDPGSEPDSHLGSDPWFSEESDLAVGEGADAGAMDELVAQGDELDEFGVEEAEDTAAATESEDPDAARLFLEEELLAQREPAQDTPLDPWAVEVPGAEADFDVEATSDETGAEPMPSAEQEEVASLEALPWERGTQPPTEEHAVPEPNEITKAQDEFAGVESSGPDPWADPFADLPVVPRRGGGESESAAVSDSEPQVEPEARIEAQPQVAEEETTAPDPWADPVSPADDVPSETAVAAETGEFDETYAESESPAEFADADADADADAEPTTEAELAFDDETEVPAPNDPWTAPADPSDPLEPVDEAQELVDPELAMEPELAAEPELAMDPELAAEPELAMETGASDEAPSDPWTLAPEAQVETQEDPREAPASDATSSGEAALDTPVAALEPVVEPPPTVSEEAGEDVEATGVEALEPATDPFVPVQESEDELALVGPPADPIHDAIPQPIDESAGSTTPNDDAREPALEADPWADEPVASSPEEQPLEAQRNRSEPAPAEGLESAAEPRGQLALGAQSERGNGRANARRQGPRNGQQRPGARNQGRGPGQKPGARNKSPRGNAPGAGRGVRPDEPAELGSVVIVTPPAVSSEADAGGATRVDGPWVADGTDDGAGAIETGEELASAGDQPAAIGERTAELESAEILAPQVRAQGLRTVGSDEMQTLWQETDVPMHLIDGKYKVLTPNVGPVRAVLNSRDIFEGTLYAIGKGSIWIDSDYGRMAIDGERLARVEKVILSETEEEPEEELESVRIKTPGGIFSGKVLSRDSKHTVLLTEGGARLTLKTDEVEYVGKKPKIIIK